MRVQFLTWFLWKHLFRALPRHPLFISQYAPTKPARKRPERIKRSLRQRLTRALIYIVGLVILIPISIVTLLPGISLTFLFILFGGTVTGAQTAYGVAAAINQRYDKKQVSMLGVTLAGVSGMSWALAVRHIRLNKQARQLRRLVVAFYAVISIGILSFLTLFPIMTAIDNTFSLSEVIDVAILPSLSVILLILMILLDMVQSVMSGALIAMIVAHIRQGNRDSSIASASLFLLVQSGIYIVFILTMVIIETLIVNDLARNLMRLWVLFVLREAVLHLLWRQFTHILNTSESEITALTSYTARE